MLDNSELAQLRVIIPVGGEAKRMKPLTAEVSKAMVRIFDRPMVEYAVWELARQGVKNFIFGAKGYVNYKSLIDYFGDGTGFSAQYGVSPRVHVKYQPRIDDVGSADSVRINMDYYNINDAVLVVQGDNLFELELGEMIRFMQKSNALMVVALVTAEDVEAYGIADIEDSTGRIRRFVEKPRREEAPSRLANTGIYALSPSIRDVFREPEVQRMIAVNNRLDFGLDFIPYLIRTGRPVYGFLLKGEWYDVGTPKHYLETMERILTSSDRVEFYLGRPVPELGNVWIQGNSRESIARRENIVARVARREVRIEGPTLVGRHCQIGNGTIVSESTIDNFCIIGDNVTIERSAILDRVVLEDGTFVQDSIIGRHVHVKSTSKDPTWILGLSVVGDDSEVGEGSTLASAKVQPHSVLAPFTGSAREQIQTALKR